MSNDLTDAEVLRIVARRRRRRRLIAALVVLLLLVVAVAAWFIIDAYWKHAFMAKLDEIRAAGGPATWDEVLASRPHVPDEENAALRFLQGADALINAETPALEALVLDNLIQPPIGVRRSPQIQEVAREYLAATADAVAMIRSAGRFEEAVYPVDLEMAPWALERPYLEDLKWAAEICCLCAQLHGETGNLANVRPAIEAACGIARSLASQPAPDTCPVGVRVYGTVKLALERTLAVAELVPADLHYLGERFRAAEEVQVGRNWLVGERASAIALIRGVPREWLFGSGFQGCLDLIAYRGIPGRRWVDGLYYLEAAEQFGAALELSPPGRVSAAQRLAQTEASLWKERRRMHVSPWQVTLLESILTADSKQRIMLPVTQAALTVERWRMENGRWPDSLREMGDGGVRELLTDPVTGSLLSLRRVEGGFRLYSVGPDGIDNGGITEQEKMHGEWLDGFSEHSDIVFRLFDPESRGARERTFREEILGTYDLSQLRNRGLDAATLKEMGLSDEDLRSLGFGP